MSETAWSPGGVLEGAEQEESGGRGRRGVLVVAGLALAAFAGGGALLLTGSDEAVLEPASPPTVAAAPAPTASAAPVTAAVPEAGQARSGRNPFLDPAPPAAVAAQPVGGGIVPAPAGEDVAAAPVGPGTQPPPAAVPGGTPDRTGPVARAESLALLRVAGSSERRTAVFRVGSEQATAGVGDSFGGAAGLLLLSLQEGPESGQWTAVVQAGLGDPFDVVSGTPVPLT